MKKIQFLIVLIPLISLAQTKKIVSTKPSFIQSITSDTSNGKFNQVLFTYDENNRVIAITNKEIKIEIGAKKKRAFKEYIIKEQIFQYTDTLLQPFSRKTTSYQPSKDNPKTWVIQSIEQLYFLYENGKRIGDSAVYLKNWQGDLEWDWKTAEPQKRIGKLQQTSQRIYHEIDLTKPYSFPDKYFDEFTLLSQLNIGNETSAYRWGNRSNEASYYTFSAFDTRLNPLKQLNVASILANEKVSSEFGGQYGQTDICWYFFNQNNYTDYTVTTDEQTQHFKYIFKFNYTYNRFQQPIYATVDVKQVFNNNGKFVRKYTQKFTFRYK